MSQLKDANVKQCLSVLNGFHKAVNVEGSNPGLLLKKQAAGKALKHMEMLLVRGAETTQENCCTNRGHEVIPG